MTRGPIGAGSKGFGTESGRRAGFGCGRVGAQQVAVLGQEARRCRRIGAGPGRVGQVEQLGARFVVEDAQVWAEPVEDLAESFRPAPGPQVLESGPAVPGEVADGEVVEGGVE
jgi:hypothetical protein